MICPAKTPEGQACGMVKNLALMVDLNAEVGVVRDIRLKELRIYTDYGLQCLIILQETHGGWCDLTANGLIEYIDTQEEETTMIFMTINVYLMCKRKDTTRPDPFITSSVNGTNTHEDDHPGNDPWHGVDHGALKDKVNKLMTTTLREQERAIIRLYYGLDNEFLTWEYISQ
ncbi:RNA polymerase sigma factor sigA-like protein, partial [Tanacetum coccineum]